MTEQIRGAIEAILFVTGDPVQVETLAALLECTQVQADEYVHALQNQYENEKRGIQLQITDYGVQMCSNRAYSKYVQRLLRPDQTVNLSDTVLETLSVIAYKQPITRGEIEAIRGVSCDYSVSVLLNKRLIMPKGRKDSLGKPMLYGTTHEFLQHFGLNSLDELPELETEDVPV